MTGPNEIFLLTYLYCLNGSVDKAEALTVANANSILANCAYRNCALCRRLTIHS